MDLTCPNCHSQDRFLTHTVVCDNADIELSDDGWDFTSPSFDMDLYSQDQLITCEACGHTFTAAEGGWEVTEYPKPIDAKLVAVHGSVSLICTLAVRFHTNDKLRLQAMLATAGHGCAINGHPAEHPLVLVCLEPSRYAAYLDAYSADKSDVDLGDAYRWIDEHFDEIPENGYLLDLPSQVRGTADAPTTTFADEYGDLIAFLITQSALKGR